MANSVKVRFNETKYEFRLDKAIPTGTDEIRHRYKILINGKVSDRLLFVSTMDNEPNACYQVLEPVSFSNRNQYITPYKQYYEKDFPMSIVFDILKFLNK